MSFCGALLIYLKGRTQCVQVEGIPSDPMEVVKGVPQGSVLGPLLFSIFRQNYRSEFRH